MKTYRLSKTIPLKTLVRAYELWKSTDMSQREVAQAVGVCSSTLSDAIRKAEKRGLYGEYLPMSSRAIVLRALESGDKLTAKDLARICKIGLSVAKSAAQSLHKRKFIKRINVATKSQPEYAYFF